MNEGDPTASGGEDPGRPSPVPALPRDLTAGGRIGTRPPRTTIHRRAGRGSAGRGAVSSRQGGHSQYAPLVILLIGKAHHGEFFV
ncbi:hypothetical protein Z951_45330 [Streptomyces sp. PRh5]|nr:hypothetical protein Z951_45330 [Streptomyces sp. PRh5]